MSKTARPDPNRRAFIVFVVLVVFCFLQLGWWIVFQINSSNRYQEMRLEMLVQQYGAENNIPADMKTGLENDAQRRMRTSTRLALN